MSPARTTAARARPSLLSPPLPEPLNQRGRLIGADLNQVRPEILAAFPLIDLRAAYPGEIAAQRLVQPPVRRECATREPSGVVQRASVTQHSKVFDVFCHYQCPGFR